MVASAPFFAFGGLTGVAVLGRVDINDKLVLTGI